MIKMQHYLRVAGFIRYIKKDIVLKILLGLCVTASYVVQALCLSRGIALVFQRSGLKQAVIWYFMAGACIIIRGILIRYLEGYTKRIGGKVKTVLREKLVEKLLLLGPGYQSDKRSGKMQSLITDGVEYLEPYLVNYIPQIFVVAFSVIPMIGYITYLCVPAGLVLVVAIVISILMPFCLMPFTQKSCIGYWREYAVLNSQYVDTMQGMDTVKLFDAELAKGAELGANSESFRSRQLINTRNSLFSSATITLMMAVATSITTGIAAYACQGGLSGTGNPERITYSGLLVIMFLVIECVRPVGEMNNHWHSSYMGLSVSKELFEILDAEVTVSEKEETIPFPDTSKKLPEIKFEDISFSYHKDREQALNHLDCTVKSGKTVAFVGASGAGKSTIINLLLRFFEGYTGKITIDDVDIRDMKIKDLRAHISVVFQQNFLFYGTVEENIRMARPDASLEEVYQAAKTACAHDFIMELENGYQTLVGERGVTLSGGQRQRISIARAILKNAPILVLDEATSSVDAQTEHVIQETIEQLSGQYTTLVIAHRLSTIQNADWICVLKDGQVAEQGTHQELMDRNAYYASFVEAQKKGMGE